MTRWQLPRSVTLAGKAFAVHTDYRDILDIIACLEDAARTPRERAYVALALFYCDFNALPPHLYAEALRALLGFLACGEETPPAAAPKLLDWQQDAGMIAAGVNKVAGCEVRALPYVHWWTFAAWFSGIGEGELATVVALRQKLARGERLTEWERTYYRENRDRVTLRTPEAEAAQEAFEVLRAELGAQKGEANGK